MPFEFHRQNISDVVLIRAKTFDDSRGSFWESFRQSAFETHGLPCRYPQDNISYSTCGVLRGLHYQKHPKAQAKLVMPVQGEIFDVAVDIRRGSPTYAQWTGINLAADRHEMLYVPEGFAHGFCVLSQRATVLYKVSAEYAPDCERGIRWNDPELAITWPCDSPTLSPRDAQLPLLKDAENNFSYNQVS
ncbi:MAG: dTDP-4-dehydrorhamnose 3,5-epimerase [Verrucomicrobia bacterium]|nr:dTDP-4-dehydrorhamnose 3,5-epimerase [Verrucomicrobiota bacterium]